VQFVLSSQWELLLRLPSPKQQQIKLEKMVAERTGEKDQLIREINHRIGNQLQIIQSMISVESRRSENSDVLQVLGRLASELDKMAGEHLQYSQADYLRHSTPLLA
jgi:two-component sensor histidine kinase